MGDVPSLRQHSIVGGATVANQRVQLMKQLNQLPLTAESDVVIETHGSRSCRLLRQMRAATATTRKLADTATVGNHCSRYSYTITIVQQWQMVHDNRNTSCSSDGNTTLTVAESQKSGVTEKRKQQHSLWTTSNKLMVNTIMSRRWFIYKTSFAVFS